MGAGQTSGAVVEPRAVDGQRVQGGIVQQAGRHRQQFPVGTRQPGQVVVQITFEHVGAAVVLTARAHRARGRFRRTGMRRFSSFTARTMGVSGIVLLAFIAFHILDLTTGTRPAASPTFTAATHTSSAAYAAGRNLFAAQQSPNPIDTHVSPRSLALSRPILGRLLRRRSRTVDWCRDRGISRRQTRSNTATAACGLWMGVSSRRSRK